eukprot:Trichotokara_eunicae@DN3567_c0_g2_i1.p1
MKVFRAFFFGIFVASARKPCCGECSVKDFDCYSICDFCPCCDHCLHDDVACFDTCRTCPGCAEAGPDAHTNYCRQVCGGFIIFPEPDLPDERCTITCMKDVHELCIQDQCQDLFPGCSVNVSVSECIRGAISNCSRR